MYCVFDSSDIVVYCVHCTVLYINLIKYAGDSTSISARLYPI